MARIQTGSGNARATIFDVADQAGVSIKTVSRVVNREANVREKTRDKVLASIKALDYRPNAAARGLSAKRSFVIGLVYENAEEFSYTKDVLGGVLSACEEQGYSLLLRPVTLPSDNLEREVESFVRLTGADGIVLPAPIGDIDVVCDLLARLEIPVARISPKHPVCQDINVFCDEDQATFELTTYLAQQGHQRIGFIRGHPDHRATEERLRGYVEALKEQGIRYDRDLVCSGLFTYESGRDATTHLLHSEHPPTAIIASNDEMACGAVHAAYECGLEIPRDLSIAGFDDTPVAARLWPPLTTVRQPIVGMAETATRLLIQKLRGEQVEMPDGPFHCDVVIRQSTDVRPDS